MLCGQIGGPGTEEAEKDQEVGGGLDREEDKAKERKAIQDLVIRK